MLLLKIAFWIAGLLAFGFVAKLMGGGNEYLAETNFVYWMGEITLLFGWFYGMSELYDYLWKKE